MKYFVTCALLNAITSILVCVFVVLSNPKSKTNRAFSYYAFSVALWAGFQFLWISSNNKIDALKSIQIACFAALFIPITFFHFSSHLTKCYKKYSNIIKFIYILNTCMLPLVFSKTFIQDVQFQLNFLYWPIAGNLFIVLVIEYVLLSGYSLFLLHKELKSTVGSQHLQLKYILYGVFLAYIGGLTNFPLCYKISVFPFGNILISFYTIFITYAIFKYQLMDIKIIIKKSLVYSILITAITIFYFLSIYFIEHIFQEIFGYKSLFISLLFATIITLIFTPLKNIIQNFLEKTLFQGSFVEIAKQNELLREEIIQTEKLKSVSILASGMAHEIKNPLTVLKTFSEFLPQKIHDPEFLQKYSPMITEEINRIDHLVHELLDFAKPAPAILKHENISNILDSTIELLTSQHIKHRIRIHKDYQIPKETLLLLDCNQIRQALLNLFLNSIEAMKNGGDLYVHTDLHNEEDYIQIKIQDTGIGIDQNDIQHIFDPFFSKKDSGTGLGLSITYEIIKKHGGKIFVESVPGKGTAFILELPTTKAHPS